jgi:uncharacterized protein (DUF952 family)
LYFAIMIGSKICDACYHRLNKEKRGSLIPHFYRNLEVSGVFEARQQWLQQGVSHLRDAGGL